MKMLKVYFTLKLFIKKIDPWKEKKEFEQFFYYKKLTCSFDFRMQLVVTMNQTGEDTSSHNTTIPSVCESLFYTLFLFNVSDENLFVYSLMETRTKREIELKFVCQRPRERKNVKNSLTYRVNISTTNHWV